MKKIIKSVSMLALLGGMSAAQAALVDYEIVGEVWWGDELSSEPNVFGLSGGDLITATGTMDDAALAAGTGTIYFGDESGNTMTIQVGTETLYEFNDSDFYGWGGASLQFDNYSLVGFDYLAEPEVNGSTVYFSSWFLGFDDGAELYGEWSPTVTITPAAVPVPAAVWLFGSGLLGLIGVARRKQV